MVFVCRCRCPQSCLLAIFLHSFQEVRCTLVRFSYRQLRSLSILRKVVILLPLIQFIPVSIYTEGISFTINFGILSLIRVNPGYISQRNSLFIHVASSCVVGCLHIGRSDKHAILDRFAAVYGYLTSFKGILQHVVRNVRISRPFVIAILLRFTASFLN